MKRYPNLVLLSFGIFTSPLSHAQNTVDTLQISREFSTNLDFSSAISVLEKYLENNPRNIFTVQLLASNYYWKGDLLKADSTYNSAIERFEDNQSLKLDYARMLYELGKYNHAKVILDDYHQRNPENVEVLEYIGYINYWWGRKTEALEYFNAILRLYPNNQTALDMVSAINHEKRPYLLAGYNYEFDTQPMQSGNASIEVGKHYTALLNPTLKLDWLHFNADNTTTQTPWFQVSNTMNFLKNKTHLNTTVGFLQQVDNQTQVSGLIELDQDITRHFSVKASIESAPYFYTSSSLLTPVMYNSANLSLLWTDPNGFNAQAFVGRQFFKDSNQIDNYYVWALSPGFGWEKWRFNLGYSYSYSNSNVNNFNSTKTLDEAKADYPSEIEGVYAPYFTPIHQNIHTILATVSFNQNKKFEWKLKSSVGVYAYADIPYLFLDNTDGKLFFNSGFDTQYLTPYEFELNAIYNINSNTSLNLKITTTENFFYHNNKFSIALKHTF